MTPVRHALAPLALLVLAAAVPAQNCANTSVGFLPVPDLGAGTYQGFQGGLYPGGSNAPPEAHLVAGLRQAAQVVPRDPAGAPDPSGRVVFLSIGMSNATQEFARFVQLSNQDPLRHPRVLAVDGAMGGQAAEDIDDPAAPYWTAVAQRLANAGVTAAQVQAVWLKEANRAPTLPFPAHAAALQAQYTTILQILQDRFPNLKVAFLASRIYAGYATTNLNPEPYAYEQGFTVKWTIEDQIGQDPALNFDPALGAVEAPWLAWGTYNWADGLVPRSDGLTWACADFRTDGTHPAPSGREKVAQALLAFVQSDPVAAAWYRARPDPFAYGTGKATSQGGVPALSWSGTPSPAGAFAVTVAGGIPNGVGLVFHGPSPARTPFLNAFRYVGPPLSRLAVQALDPAGSTSYAIGVAPGMVGTTRCYQAYLRDVFHPDGTGAVVSDGLRVVFQP